MKLILTHEQADLDALASALGARLLDKEAFALLPRNINRNAFDFIKKYQAELGFSSISDLPREPISHITLVDTQSLVTLKGLNEETKIKVIDHHPRKEGVNPEWEIEISHTGSCATLLVEKLKSEDTLISPIQASMLLLGIYEDTGSLAYITTTARDLVAAAYLLEKGADLKLISNFLNPPLTSAQQLLYDRLIKNMQSHLIQNQTILTAKANAMDVYDEISSVAHKLRDFLDPDALLLFVLTKQGIRLVARSTTDAVDVGKIAASFGGGGHPRAASALIRPEGKLDTDEMESLLDTIYDQMIKSLPQNVRPILTVHNIMSKNPLILTTDTPIDEVARLMLRYGYEGYPVMENGKIVGLITRRMVDRALTHKMSLPASSLMEAGEISVYPEDSLETLQKVMASSGWGQIPVVDSQSGNIVGIVTRTDLIKTRTMQKRQPDQSTMVKLLKRAIPSTRLALLQAIANEADKQHTPVYIVGGFVRDLLLGVPSLDFDIVVEGDALYFAKILVKAFGGRYISHSRFGTAKWFLEEEKGKIAEQLNTEYTIDPKLLPSHLDIITARTEFYDKPAALPTVESSSIKMDLHRRDFTINTLALRLDGEYFGKIFDFWGGLADLQDQKIRVLHALSFVDDATRLMRAVRFEQRFGFEIEERTLALLKESLPLLQKTSGTRLRHELELMVAENRSAEMFKRMSALGMLEAIHPALVWSEEISEKFERLNTLEVPDAWELPSQVEHLSIKQALSFIYWLSEIEQSQLDKVHQHLRLPSKLVEYVLQATSLKKDLNGLCTKKPSEIFHHLIGIPRLVIFSVFFENQFAPETICLQKFVTQFSKIQPIITGNDLRKRGLMPSPKFAEIISQLRDGWLDGDIKCVEDEEKKLQRLLDTTV